PTWSGSKFQALSCRFQKILLSPNQIHGHARIINGRRPDFNRKAPCFEQKANAAVYESPNAVRSMDRELATGLGRQTRLIFECEFEQAVAALKSQLLADIGPVVFDGMGTKTKTVGNFLARQVLRNEGENALFGGGEGFQLGFFCEKGFGLGAAIQEQRGKSRTDKSLSSDDAMDAAEKVVGGAFFENIAKDAGIDGLVKNARFLVHREDDKSRGEARFEDFSREGQAVERGHIEVEHGNLWTQLINDLPGLQSVGRLGDDLQRRIFAEDLAQPGAKNGMIIGDQDRNGCLHKEWRRSSARLAPGRFPVQRRRPTGGRARANSS